MRGRQTTCCGRTGEKRKQLCGLVAEKNEDVVRENALIRAEKREDK